MPQTVPHPKSPLDFTMLKKSPLDFTMLNKSPLDFTMLQTSPLDFTMLQKSPLDFTMLPKSPSISQSVPPGLAGREVHEIHAVEAGWKKIGMEEITIDSAAEESVCPREWGAAFGTKPTDRKLRFINASGGEMGHYGERTANFRTVGEAAVMSLTFQVSDVKKPLAAVRRIAEKGNIVQFGPRPEDNFIMHVASGRRIAMIKKGGSYVVPAELIVKEMGFTGQAC
jgi:hypothetical protein